MTLLVTGLSGFVGAYIADRLPAVGLDGDDGQPVDLSNEAETARVLASVNPAAIIHLAAQSSVPDAFRAPLATYQTNFIGTLNLLRPLAESGFRGRILFVSSADIYGSVAENALPITEAQLAQPLNPYAVSKVVGEELCRYFHRVEGLDIVIVRPFNHIGPRQSTRFAIADFARSIIEMKLGRRPAELSVGDLDVTRDFTDVRDVVQGYERLLEQGESGATYNICSGTERHMGEAVRTLMDLAGVDGKIVVDPSRLRKAGQRRVRGSYDKLRITTGWAPAIAWEQSLKDILDDWENRLR